MKFVLPVTTIAMSSIQCPNLKQQNILQEKMIEQFESMMIMGPVLKLKFDKEWM